MKLLIRAIVKVVVLFMLIIPPIPVIKEGDSERVKRNNEEQRQISIEKRAKSREKLLNHIVNNCPEVYKLNEWDSICSMMENYTKRMNELEQSNNPDKNEELKKEKNDLVKKVDRSIEGSLGFNIPGLVPVSLNFGFKKNNIQEEHRASIEVLPKEI
ncbi:MAG: hypothetical protein GBAus27B_000528 [Mycoplasmataceae bacterium]|nr:MAG: hypothetical protein GBAus27B_000528 [Mycoplasmataceae bacterium]